MKILLITLLGSFLFSTANWQTDFDKARQSAQAEKKLIILNFSGSDWCGPCIRMHGEIFESASFSQYATEHLVLVNADFPRLKKNQLSKEQQKKNDQLADVYDKEGIFPLTLLMTPDGNVLKTWEGFPNISADQFTREVKAVVDANM
jgi:thioredoxin-related protein